jgi:hypothetical protein
MLNAQYPGAMYVSGGINSWGATAMSYKSYGTPIWTVTINSSSSSNDFKFRDSDANWTNSWGRGDIVTTGGKFSAFWSGGNSNFTFSANKYYTFNWKHVAYGSNSESVLFETSAQPVTLSNPNRIPGTVYSYQKPVVYVDISSTLPTGQGVYIRYTTENWVNSTITAMTLVSGTTYRLELPAKINGTTVKYYFLTSGSGLSINHSDADLFTITILNNSGSNYEYTVQAGTVRFTSADGNWSSTSSWEGGNKPSSSDIAVIQHTISLNEDVTVSNLLLNIDKSLTINQSNALTISGELANNNGNSGVIIKSDATGTGRLKHNTNSVSGTVERYFTGTAESWHFLSSPVASQEISGSFTPSGSYGDGTGYDFYTWYEPSMIWVNKKNTTVAPTWATANGDNNFAVGRGYLVAYQASNPIKSFAGNLNNGTIDYALSKSGTGSYAAYNLVGNPYPSSIDWKAASGWTRNALVNNSGYDMWIYNAAEGNYGVYNSSDADDNGTNNVTRYIPVGQGFMVKAASAINLTMTNDVRTTQNPSFLKSTSDVPNILRLQMTSLQNGFSDEIKIEFGHQNDVGGAEKMFSFEEKAPSLFTVKSTGNYSTDYRGELSQITIPVSFRAGTDGEYSLIAKNLESFGNNALISIEDLNLNLTHDLRIQPQFTFSAKKSDNESRFLLHFGGTNGISEKHNDPLNIFASDETIVIINNLGKSTSFDIRIYNLMGQLIYHNNTENQSAVRIPLSAPTGYYFVKVVTPEATQTAKVFVK